MNTILEPNVNGFGHSSQKWGTHSGWFGFSLRIRPNRGPLFGATHISLGVDSPFFSTMVLFENQLFPMVVCGLLERRIPGKNGEATLRISISTYFSCVHLPRLLSLTPRTFCEACAAGCAAAAGPGHLGQRLPPRGRARGDAQRGPADQAGWQPSVAGFFAVRGGGRRRNPNDRFWGAEEEQVKWRLNSEFGVGQDP